jgi:hypothetical protein
MDINQLRTLITLRWFGRHGELAKRAGCSRRTIVRLLHEPDYLPRYRTFLGLREAARGWKK